MTEKVGSITITPNAWVKEWCNFESARIVDTTNAVLEFQRAASNSTVIDQEAPLTGIQLSRWYWLSLIRVGFSIAEEILSCPALAHAASIKYDLTAAIFIKPSGGGDTDSSGLTEIVCTIRHPVFTVTQTHLVTSIQERMFDLPPGKEIQLKGSTENSEFTHNFNIEVMNTGSGPEDRSHPDYDLYAFWVRAESLGNSTLDTPLSTI